MDSPCFVLSISMLSILGISLVGLQIASFYTPSFTEIGGNNPCCWRDIILASDYWIGLKMASMDSPHWVLLMEMLWHAFCSNLIHDLSHLFTSSVQYKFNSGIYTYLNMTATSLAQNRTPLIQNRTPLIQNRTLLTQKSNPTHTKSNPLTQIQTHPWWLFLSSTFYGKSLRFDWLYLGDLLLDLFENWIFGKPYSWPFFPIIMAYFEWYILIRFYHFLIWTMIMKQCVG